MHDRYSRQIILPEIGENGQSKLSSSKAIIVGAGGLGSIVLYYLAAAGIGQIKIIDSDKVDITNLNRQLMHDEADIGKEKSISAMEKLQRFNSEINVTESSISLNTENINGHIFNCDIVVACVDNKKTRILLNSHCVNKNIPLIDGGINGFEGYVLTILPGITPCFSCLFPESKEISKPIGVIGAAVGVIGSMMALQTVKTLLGVKMDYFLYYVDLMSLRILPMAYNKNPNCPICGFKKTK